jgi:hypothetical protein
MNKVIALIIIGAMALINVPFILQGYGLNTIAFFLIVFIWLDIAILR